MTMRMVISNNNDHKLLFSNMLLRTIMTVKKISLHFMVLRQYNTSLSAAHHYRRSLKITSLSVASYAVYLKQTSTRAIFLGIVTQSICQHIQAFCVTSCMKYTATCLNEKGFKHWKMILKKKFLNLINGIYLCPIQFTAVLLCSKNLKAHHCQQHESLQLTTTIPYPQQVTVRVQ